MSLKHLNVLAEDDDDPMLSAVNLVDVFLVLVVALLTAVAVQSQTSANESVTIIRNAGQPQTGQPGDDHGGIDDRLEQTALHYLEGLGLF